MAEISTDSSNVNGVSSEPLTSATTEPTVSAGPLFKELYTGIVDVEDPDAVQSILSAERRAFLDHTTDIHSYAQFQSLHRLPEKWGTAFHHRSYVATLESLQK